MINYFKLESIRDHLDELIPNLLKSHVSGAQFKF